MVYLGLGLKWNEELNILGLMKKTKQNMERGPAEGFSLLWFAKKNLESKVLTDLK